MNKEDFYKKVREFAETHNMSCTMCDNDGKWCVKVEYVFCCDDFYIVHRTESYSIKESHDGLVNYWSETIHDGRHHIMGPGYMRCVGDQKPVTLDYLCGKFLKELSESARYYQPIKR